MTDWLRRAYRWLTEPPPPPEFEGDAPPDWVVSIFLQALPGSYNYRIRVQLWPDRVRLVSQTRVLWFKVPNPLQEEWTGEQTAGLLRLVERAFVEPKPRQPSAVEDGLPTGVVLFRREPPGVGLQSWNLAAWWWPGEPLEGLPPSVELAALLYIRARRHAIESS